jgi:hypothetical protein
LTDTAGTTIPVCPLAELAPGAVVPGLGTVTELLAKLEFDA